MSLCLMDNEFECLQDMMLRRSAGVPLNICAPDEHVPEVERVIRTVKERVRSLISTLPFKSLPEIVLVHAVLFSILWLNFFPPQGGIHKTLSPEAIVKGRKVDAKLHCKMPFGAYAQVFGVTEQETNNALVSRTVGGVSLGPTGNAQGTYKFVSLLTWRLIKARSFTPLPMPDEVVNQVNDKAKEGNTGLAFGNRIGEVTIGDLHQDVDGDKNSDDDSYDDYQSAAESEEDEEGVEDQDLNENLSVGDMEVMGIHHQPVQRNLQQREGPTQLDAISPSNVSNDPVQIHFESNNLDLPSPVQSMPEEENMQEILKNEGVESVSQSILDIAQEFEENLDNPNFSPPSARRAEFSPSYESESVMHLNENAIPDTNYVTPRNYSESPKHSETSTNQNQEQDVTSNRTTDDESSQTRPDPSQPDEINISTRSYVTRAGRHIRPRRFFMHEGFGALAKEHGDPELWRPSAQTTFGLRSKLGLDHSFSHAHAIHHCMTQLSLKQGLRAWKDKAVEAVRKEMQQMHDKKVYDPVDHTTMTRQEKLAALRSIIFLKQKRCGRIKARVCADGRPQRKLYEKQDAASPTVKTESVLLTCVQEAEENRDVCVADIPGAFLNAFLKEVVHMKLEGVLAEALVSIAPDVYGPMVFTNDKGILVIYVRLTRALYGCLKSSLQWYKQLSKVLFDEGFEPNPYDPCVVNKNINGSQCTICWHVDDLKISHKDSKVVDDILDVLRSIYGKLSVTRGKHHTYLGMDLDFSVPGEVAVSMIPYMQEIVDEYPEDLGNRSAKTPAAACLFDINPEPTYLPKEKADQFHHIVAKLLWASLRARPDILLAVSFLTSRVKKPDEDDWGKLTRLVVYIKYTVNLVLRLASDCTRVSKWWIDASFGTRVPDLKSHTGGCLSQGKGAIISMSKKQKLNTKSSTEAELVGVDDVLPQVLWTCNFLLNQGWNVEKNVIYQDNKSAILLEENGMASSSKRTKHIDIRFYFIKDRIDAGEVTVEYCPTGDMWGDYFTKPLQGSRFLHIRRIIMNESSKRSVLDKDDYQKGETDNKRNLPCLGNEGSVLDEHES